MMTRPALLVPVLAIAGLLAAAPVAPAETAVPEAHFAYTSFKLVADHGLQVHVEGHDGEVRIEVRREGRRGGSFVFYEVEGESTEAGLKAQFGQLGSIDVAFKPTNTWRTEEPPKGCEGEPSTFREGIFSGTIEFTGEREYVRIDAARVEGKMNILRESEWQCSQDKGSRRLRRGARPPAISPRKQPREKEAFLTVGSASCSCALLVSAVRDRNGRGPTGFLGVQHEEQEGMEITRGTYSEVGSSAFTFDYATGIAKVHPPRPFSGDATFKRRRPGHNLWSSTIRVPFLGVGPVGIRGRGCLAILHRHIPYDE